MCRSSTYSALEPLLTLTACLQTGASHNVESFLPCSCGRYALPECDRVRRYCCTKLLSSVRRAQASSEARWIPGCREVLGEDLQRDVDVQRGDDRL